MKIFSSELLRGVGGSYAVCRAVTRRAPPSRAAQMLERKQRVSPLPLPPSSSSIRSPSNSYLFSRCTYNVRADVGVCVCCVRVRARARVQPGCPATRIYAIASASARVHVNVCVMCAPQVMHIRNAL